MNESPFDDTTTKPCSPANNSKNKQIDLIVNTHYDAILEDSSQDKEKQQKLTQRFNSILNKKFSMGKKSENQGKMELNKNTGFHEDCAEATAKAATFLIRTAPGYFNDSVSKNKRYTMTKLKGIRTIDKKDLSVSVGHRNEVNDNDEAAYWLTKMSPSGIRKVAEYYHPDLDDEDTIDVSIIDHLPMHEFDKNVINLRCKEEQLSATCKDFVKGFIIHFEDEDEDIWTDKNKWAAMVLPKHVHKMDLC